MAEEIRKQDEAELQAEMSPEELDKLQAESLPDRENMSLIDANVAVPVNAAVAANVLSDHSNAGAGAAQNAPINQAHPHHH